MTHLAEDRLRAALAGDDTDGDHLAGCPDCQQRFEALAAGETNWLLPASRSTPATPPAELIDSLHALATGPHRETVAQLETLDDLFPGLRPGDGTRPRIGPYELHAVVGRGGMGVVIQGYDVRLERAIALKIPAPHLRTDPVARSRFVREGRSAALLTHPNALPVFAVEEYAGVPLLVMPFVVGESLQQRLDRDGKLPPAAAVGIALQVALALEAAHAVGLVHRDVKPANVLLDAGTDHVRLTDFGLARAADDARLTQTGVGAGTPTFMAPEQARGDAVDHRADLFSLGSLLFTALAGRVPFGSATLMGTLRRIADGKPDSLRSHVPDLPKHVEGLVMDLLQNDPNMRPQTATAAVERLRQSARLLAAGVETTRPYRRWVAATLLVGVGLTALAAGVVFKFPTPEGTLVVEVDDPNATVTFDQDGKEVTVTAGDVKEFKMKLGSHKVTTTTTDGPKTDIVQITRGGKTVVTARYEPKAVASKPAIPLSGPSAVVQPDIKPLPDVIPDVRPRMGRSPDGTVGGVIHKDVAAAIGLNPPGFRLKEVRTYEGHTGPIRAVAVTPDGKRLISSTSWPAGDGTVRVWDAAAGTLLHTLRGQTGDVPALAVSPDGKNHLSGGAGGLLISWNIYTGKESNRIELPGKPLIVSLAFDPSSRRFAAGLSDNTVVLFDMNSWSPVATFQGHTGRVRTVAFSPDGKSLLSGSEDESVRAWDVATGRMLWMNTLGRGWVEQVAFTPNGQRWLAVDRQLVIGEATDGKLRPSPTLPARMVGLTGVAISANQRLMAVTGYNGWVTLIPDDPSLAPMVRKVNDGNANCVAFSPDGKKLYVGGGGVYDPATKHYQAKDEVIREFNVESLRDEAPAQAAPAQPKR